MTSYRDLWSDGVWPDWTQYAGPSVVMSEDGQAHTVLVNLMSAKAPRVGMRYLKNPWSWAAGGWCELGVNLFIEVAGAEPLTVPAYQGMLVSPTKISGDPTTLSNYVALYIQTDIGKGWNRLDQRVGGVLTNMWAQQCAVPKAYNGQRVTIGSVKMELAADGTLKAYANGPTNPYVADVLGYTGTWPAGISRAALYFYMWAKIGFVPTPLGNIQNFTYNSSFGGGFKLSDQPPAPPDVRRPAKAKGKVDLIGRFGRS